MRRAGKFLTKCRGKSSAARGVEPAAIIRIVPLMSANVQHVVHPAGHGVFIVKAVIAGLAVVLLASVGARAEDSVPLAGPKPVFVPGMYETESRNSHFQNQPVTSKSCIASADFDHFRDETLQ